MEKSNFLKTTDRSQKKKIGDFGVHILCRLAWPLHLRLRYPVTNVYSPDKINHNHGQPSGLFPARNTMLNRTFFTTEGEGVDSLQERSMNIISSLKYTRIETIRVIS
jgi:hypothetical protein